MANGTARIVLSLLGLDGGGYLEGELPVARFRALVAGITPEAVKQAVVLPRQLGPNGVDHGCAREWLESRIAGLDALVAEAEQTGRTEIIWK